jgi:hypothetical protein
MFPSVFKTTANTRHPSQVFRQEKRCIGPLKPARDLERIQEATRLEMAPSVLCRIPKTLT